MKKELYIVPLENLVIFPGVLYPLTIRNPHLIDLLEKSFLDQEELGFFAKHPQQPENGLEIFETGVRAKILELKIINSDTAEILLKGFGRIKIDEIIEKEPFLKIRYKSVSQRNKNSIKAVALYRKLKTAYKELFPKEKSFSIEIGDAVESETDPVKGTDMIIATLEATVLSKQKILEEPNVERRIALTIDVLSLEKKIIDVEEEIQAIVDSEIDKTQREILLREQLRAIKKELGEDEEDSWEGELNQLKKEVFKKKMPEEAQKAALKEIDRLFEMPPMSPEYTVSRTYIDWLLSLPWGTETKDTLDLKKAQRTLDRDHYNLKEAKERIIEYLAVQKLNPQTKSPIICLVGPPGVGKTSLGQSIARALNRKFARFSVGGIRDEAEIRGHRRTYIGALPGRIIQLVKEAGSQNPVLMLDEIDKIGQDFLHGDPASALLEALDPEQNNSFTDHYLDVKFDLSRILFILTANVTYQIPSALLDRLEVIELPGYITEEKVKIANRFLIPRQIKEKGLSKNQLTFTSKAIHQIITEYTDEAGLRELERKIATISRKIARRVAEGETDLSVTITPDDLNTYLGAPKEFSLKISRKHEIGVVNGLAWTSTGGELLLVEAMLMQGGKQLTLTGQLGEVMQESAQAALTYIRSFAAELHIPPTFYNDVDIHIHLPEGAVPKDGPSAGVTLTTAMVSILTDIPVRRDVAMTGEISLRGKILPVGAIKEKVIAAHRGKIKTVIIPKANEKELMEVPEHIRKKLNFHLVEDVKEVIKLALLENPYQVRNTQTKLKRIMDESKGNEDND